MSAIPAGFRLAKDSSVRRCANGCVLIGGTPIRVLRLSQMGRKQADQLFGGYPVTDRTSALACRLVGAGHAHPRPPADALKESATIVIPVRDRPSQLRRCLRAIGDAAEVIVVDDGSDNAQSIAGVCQQHGARLLRLSPSRGPSAARNAALFMIESDLIAFVDSDTAPEDGWLRQLMRHFADPTVAAAAPRIRPLANGTSVLERYALGRSPLDMGPREAAVVPYGRVPYVPTATIVVRRNAFEECGGFDERLWCAEDVDLVWRLHDAGWQIRYDPSTVVRHEEPSTWRAFLGRHRFYGQWSGPLGRRHPRRLAHIVISPLPATSAALILLRRPRLAAVIGVIQALSLAHRLKATEIPWRLSIYWTAQWVTLTVVGFGRAATIFMTPGLVAALIPRRTRATAAALLLALPAKEFIVRRPHVNPMSWAAACIADEFAYGIGVLEGCIRARTTEPLHPRWGTQLLSSQRQRGVVART